MTYKLTEASFLESVATHEMHLLRDDGVYRHVRFKRPGTACMHFDLITWPGYLCYCGDMGTFVFSRLNDMFEFFRTDREYGRRRGDRRLFVNHDYWSEKLEAVDGKRQFGCATEYSVAAMLAYVKRVRLSWIRDAFNRRLLSKEERKALWHEVEEKVIDRLKYEDEEEAYRALREFEWLPDRLRCGPRYEFRDYWEENFHQYTHRFQWCCFALAWGIEQYDMAKEVAW